MTTGAQRPATDRPPVDAGRLWAGGAATALVAGLVALIGVLLCDGLFDITLAEPPLLRVGDSLAVQFAVTAAVLALVATGVGHALLLTTPRPRAFFGWLVGLATTAAAVLALTAEGSTAGRLASAGICLVVGLSVLSLLSPVLALAARPRPVGGPPPAR